MFQKTCIICIYIVKQVNLNIYNGYVIYKIKYIIFIKVKNGYILYIGIFIFFDKINMQ